MRFQKEGKSLHTIRLMIDQNYKGKYGPSTPTPMPPG
ncbi:MAG: hypothetical protein HY731_15610 [Candidatus Tectomicrobia bacterium]|nr:hypothetical protein [Candidatus Tectomicrobia bacterium]